MAKQKTIKSRHRGSSRGPQKKGPKSKPPDTRLRNLLRLTDEGVRRVTIRGSREASRLGKFWAGVQKYIQTGDDSALFKFKGKTFTDASGKRHLFFTDLRQLDRQASAGVLSFESIYAGGGR
jgi:hypothetical protein